MELRPSAITAQYRVRGPNLVEILDSPLKFQQPVRELKFIKRARAHREKVAGQVLSKILLLMYRKLGMEKITVRTMPDQSEITAMNL